LDRAQASEQLDYRLWTTLGNGRKLPAHCEQSQLVMAEAAHVLHRSDVR
jgi:hypothetical protein